MRDEDEFMSNLVSQLDDEELDILFTSLKESEEEENNERNIQHE